MYENDAIAGVSNDAHMAYSSDGAISTGEQNQVAGFRKTEIDGCSFIGKVYRGSWHFYTEMVEDVSNEPGTVESF